VLSLAKLMPAGRLEPDGRAGRLRMGDHGLEILARLFLSKAIITESWP
jgi:hypothetical protein